MFNTLSKRKTGEILQNEITSISGNFSLSILNFYSSKIHNENKEYNFLYVGIGTSNKIFDERGNLKSNYLKNTNFIL